MFNIYSSFPSNTFNQHMVVLLWLTHDMHDLGLIALEKAPCNKFLLFSVFWRSMKKNTKSDFLPEKSSKDISSDHR